MARPLYLSQLWTIVEDWEYPHLIVLIRDMRAPTHIGTGGRWNIQDVYTAYVVDVTSKYYSFRAMSSY